MNDVYKKIHADAMTSPDAVVDGAYIVARSLKDQGVDGWFDELLRLRTYGDSTDQPMFNSNQPALELSGSRSTKSVGERQTRFKCSAA